MSTKHFISQPLKDTPNPLGIDLQVLGNVFNTTPWFNVFNTTPRFNVFILFFLFLRNASVKLNLAFLMLIYVHFVKIGKSRRIYITL